MNVTINKDITGKIAGIALVCLVSVSVPGTQPENRVTVVYGAEEGVRYSLSSTANVTPLIMVHFIDVGQGDAILIDYGNYEMLIDGGELSQAAAYLPSHVDGALEVMIATHPHADHIGGLINVLDDFTVEHIWLNGDNASTATYTNFIAKVNAEGAQGAQIHQARRGDQISLSTLTFHVFHPTTPLGSDKNENSIALKLSFGQVDFLFTGDAGSVTETSMMSAGLFGDIEVLKVGHHGSRYSSTAEFLSVTKPEIAVYSAGIGNTYGHPAPETLTRLRGVGASIYGTDIYGTVIIESNGLHYGVAGDANGDKNINAPDITMIERIIAGLELRTFLGDANLDGAINALDVTRVERFIAHLK